MGEFEYLRDSIQQVQDEVHRVHHPESWILSLNRYQRDNLLSILEIIMKEKEFNLLNSGDWVGEIYGQIQAGGKIEQANYTLEDHRTNHA